MTLGIGKVEFGVLKRAMRGKSRGLKRLWYVMAQGRGWHVTTRSEVPKVRQWARLGALERGYATMEVKCSWACKVVKWTYCKVRRWAKTMDCGTYERDMDGGAASSPVFRQCFPSLFPYSAFAPGNDNRDVMNGCLHCTTTWSGRGYSLLSAIFTGDPGNDVRSPRNDKRQSSQFQIIRYLTSCAGDGPHLVYSISYLLEIILEGQQMCRSSHPIPTSWFNDCRAAYPRDNEPSHHVPRISSDPRRGGENSTYTRTIPILPL